MTLVASSAMAKAVPEFNTKVGSGGLLTFPVQTLAPERVKEIAGTSSVQVPLAVATDYSIFFTLSGQIDVTTALKPASLINPARQVVAPGSETVLSALDDFASTSDYILLLGTVAACVGNLTVLGINSHAKRTLRTQAREPTRGRWRPTMVSSSTRSSLATVPRQLRWSTGFTTRRARMSLPPSRHATE
jgi:hypothetical protein